MNGQDRYEAWKRERSDVEVDERFADLVMAKVRASGARKGHVSVNAPAGRTWRRAAAAAVLAAGLAVALTRMAAMAAFVLGISQEVF